MNALLTVEESINHIIMNDSSNGNDYNDYAVNSDDNDDDENNGDDNDDN